MVTCHVMPALAEQGLRRAIRRGALTNAGQQAKVLTQKAPER